MALPSVLCAHIVRTQCRSRLKERVNRAEVDIVLEFLTLKIEVHSTPSWMIKDYSREDTFFVLHRDFVPRRVPRFLASSLFLPSLWWALHAALQRLQMMPKEEREKPKKAETAETYGRDSDQDRCRPAFIVQRCLASERVWSLVNTALLARNQCLRIYH